MQTSFHLSILNYCHSNTILIVIFKFFSIIFEIFMIFYQIYLNFLYYFSNFQLRTCFFFLVNDIYQQVLSNLIPNPGSF